MKLLLARHGETDWNAAGRIQGRTDIPLNARGRAQAGELARQLEARGLPIDALYTSPQRRAFETAEIVGGRLGLRPVPVEDLREVSFGIWEGHSWSEIGARWSAELAACRNDRFSVGPPGGENFSELLVRVLPALEHIAAGGGGTALVVCHGAVIQSVLCHRAGCDLSRVDEYLPKNAQWATLEF